MLAAVEQETFQIAAQVERQRADPDVLNGSRRIRIAKGAGRTVQEVNQLVTQFNQMKKMMKVAGKPGALGKLPFGPRFPG